MATTKRTSDKTQEVPDECLEQVLARVDSKADQQAVCLVCTRWHKVQRSVRTTLRFVIDDDSDGTQAFLERRLLVALQTWNGLSSLAVEYPRAGEEQVLRRRLIRFRPHVSFLACNPATSLNLRRLTSLQLIGCDGVNDELMVSLGAGGSLYLKHLSLRHCSPGFSDRGMLALVPACTGLKTLEIGNENSRLITDHSIKITDAGIDALLSHYCVGLQRLRLGSCDEVRGWGVRHGRALTHLNLVGCSATKEGLQKGLRGLTFLRSLNLRWQQSYEWDHYFEVVGHLGTLLEELYLRDAVIEDQDLLAVVQGCQRLRVLDLSFCHHMGWVGLCAVANHALQLQELDLSQCNGLDDYGLEVLQQGCPQLRLLKLFDDRALRKEIEELSDLEQEDVAINNFSDEGVQLFCKARPDVSIVFGDVDYEVESLDDQGQEDLYFNIL